MPEFNNLQGVDKERNVAWKPVFGEVGPMPLLPTVGQKTTMVVKVCQTDCVL